MRKILLFFTLYLIGCGDFVDVFYDVNAVDRGISTEIPTSSHCGLAPMTTPETTLATCQDEIDNDSNGYIDCSDFSCSKSTNASIVAYCNNLKENTVLKCSNGLDDDGNGFTDCYDFDCRISTVTEIVEHCHPSSHPLENENTLSTCQDNIDNDGNGYTDCGDFSCSKSTNASIVAYCNCSQLQQ